MERICKYPKCQTVLSDRVLFQITFCGIHQRELRLLKERLALENLPEGDILFIFRHPNGCNCMQLAIHLGLLSATILGYLKRQVLKGKKDEYLGVWNIPIEEIERVIILVRNYITVYKAAKIAGVWYGMRPLSYAKEGYLGEARVNLSGYWAIRKERISGLKERLEEISRARQQPKNWLKKKGWLQDGELLTSEIAKKVGISISGVNYWIKKGQLPARKIGYYWAVLKTDFIKFAQEAVNGKYLLKRRVKQALRGFLSQSNPP